MTETEDDHAPDGGFRLDMRRMRTRRGALALIGVAGAAGGWTLLRGGSATEFSGIAADGSV